MPGFAKKILSAEEYSHWKSRQEDERRQVAVEKEMRRQAEIQAGTRQMTGDSNPFLTLDQKPLGGLPQWSDPGMLFKDIKGLSPATLKVLGQLGFEIATPVQEACIPSFLGHKDVAVDACTGSGKTLAFVIPIIEKLRQLEEQLRRTQVGAIIITPTRELARQVSEVAAPFCKSVPWLQQLLLTGGSDILLDVKAFEERGGNLIVGTPGRIMDVMKRSALLETKTLEVLVLDEADRLLDMGFKKQLDFIMGRLPKQRRTGLFSATQTEAVGELARAGLRNAVKINVAVRLASSEAGTSPGIVPQKTPLGLRLSYQVCRSTFKLGLFLQFLQEHRDEKTIAFMLTCACVDLWASLVKRIEGAEGLQITVLHGRMKQSQRQAALAAFANQAAGCLLCTDVAARGLDLPDIDWILQLDPPQSPDSFVHRVGRTARMGRAGNALIYLLPHEIAYVDFLRVRKMPIEEEAAGGEVPDLMPVLRSAAIQDREVLEKGIRAFVSYIRGYKEHQCKFIFRLQDLDLAELAYSCALLQLPRMPEVRKLGGKLAAFEPADINPNDVKFQDKERQRAHEKKLFAKATAKAESFDQNQRKKQHPVSNAQERRVPAAKRRQIEERQDISDFANEYTLLKRLKKGKLSEEEYEMAAGMADDSDVEDAQPAAFNQGKNIRGKGKGKAFRQFKQSQKRKGAAKRKKK